MHWQIKIGLILVLILVLSLGVLDINNTLMMRATALIIVIAISFLGAAYLCIGAYEEGYVETQKKIDELNRMMNALEKKGVSDEHR